MTRCMIVDRSNVIRKVAKRILSAPDRYMVEADTGAAALTMCEAEMPDTIVVDSYLTDIEVESFIRGVRALPKGDQATIIVSMAEADLVRITRAKRAGADDYLLKPFDRSQLLLRFRTIQRAAA